MDGGGATGAVAAAAEEGGDGAVTEEVEAAPCGGVAVAKIATTLTAEVKVAMVETRVDMGVTKAATVATRVAMVAIKVAMAVVARVDMAEAIKEATEGADTAMEEAAAAAVTAEEEDKNCTGAETVDTARVGVVDTGAIGGISGTGAAISLQ